MPSNEEPFNLFDYFLGEESLNQNGDRTAIEFRGSHYTYRKLHEYSAQWASLISEHGISAGDRVALLLYDSPEFVACFLGVVSLGAVCVPINTFLSSDDVAFIISDCGARLAIAESELREKLTAIRDCAVVSVDTSTRVSSDRATVKYNPTITPTTSDSPAFLLYTSGSTGSPKGVLHLHGSIPNTVENYCKSVLRLTNEDRVYSSSRMFFAYGLGNSLSFPLAAGATALLDTERATPEHITKLIQEKSPTVFFGVPAVYLSLLEHQTRGNKLDFSDVRLCVSAGEALPAQLFEDWQHKVGSTIYDGIGSTEMLHIFISNTPECVRAGSSGTLVTGYDAQLVDDDGNQVAVDQPGNLWIHGGSGTAGYWNRPKLTEQTIKHGWVRTGDVYRRDKDGFFFHIGRSDDCFKVRGLWVSPIEVEWVLVSHPAISEAAVVSAIDDKGLATVRAFVVIRQGERGDALKELIREFAGLRLPQYKVPTQIEFLDEMPRTATGKVQRYKLRAGSG